LKRFAAPLAIRAGGCLRAQETVTIYPPAGRGGAPAGSTCIQGVCSMASTSLDPQRPGYVPRAGRVAFTARHGMVASAHPLASLAGQRVLMDGGHAVDAAIATAAALNAVEPNMSGALGVGQMLIRPAGDEVVALDFGGRSPAAATPQAFAGLDAIPKDDVRTPLVPANLGGWLAALERFGTMDRARVFRDVIDYADNGFPLTEGNAGWIGSNVTRLERFDTSRRLLADNPQPTLGAIWRQPQLAESYRRFVAEGADALYRGAIGEEVARYLRQEGGLITTQDLRRVEPRWTSPIRTRFREYDVRTMPPPSMGVQILLTLNLMEGFDGRALGHNSAPYLHALIESIKLASVDRAEYTTRPDAPVAALLSKEYADRRRALIDPRRAAPSPGERWTAGGSLVAGRPGDPGHTTYLCAADADGTVVSMTQSLGNAFGCGRIAGDTGLFLNDFAWWFDLTEGSPNRIAPNTPVEQCLSPTMTFQGDQFLLAIGTPGGHGIPQTTSQMLLNALEFGMNVQQAIEAPRIRTFDGVHVDVESRVPEAVRAELEALGHVLTVLPPFHWGVGGGQGLYRVPASGAIMGGADPRRDGYAMGW
jgi:gamma-glutamyltranspeptidase/glutathione hydrolase